VVVWAESCEDFSTNARNDKNSALEVIIEGVGRDEEGGG